MNPVEYHGLFEVSAKDALVMFLTRQGANNVINSDIPDFQIVLTSTQVPLSLRHLTADHVNKIIKVYI